MLSALSFARQSLPAPVSKLKDERKRGKGQRNANPEPRSNLTIGSETSVASDTMFAILQTSGGVAEDGADHASGTSSAVPGALGGLTDDDQIWWINHPLMQRTYALNDKVDDCYDAMKRIIDSEMQHVASPDLETLRVAIADHKIKFPASQGLRKIFHIIDVFFVVQTPSAA